MIARPLFFLVLGLLLGRLFGWSAVAFSLGMVAGIVLRNYLLMQEDKP